MSNLQLTIAIDPGAGGGIAVRLCGQQAYAFAMPETEGDLMEELAALAERSSLERVPRTAYLELVRGFIGGVKAPGSAMFTFGAGYGFLRGVLMSQGWRLIQVPPEKWTKRVGIGTRRACATAREWKNKLKAEAQRRFPDLKVTNATADALLMLEVCEKGGVE